MIKAIIFDLGNTLVSEDSGNAFPYAVEVLYDLKEKYKLALITNVHHTTTSKKVQEVLADAGIPDVCARAQNGVRGKNGGETLPRKRKKQDTVNYTLRKGRKVVYKGITNNPERRVSEHRSEGKKFTSMTTSRRVSRPTALRREKIQIKEFKRNKGKIPKYNKRK